MRWTNIKTRGQSQRQTFSSSFSENTILPLSIVKSLEARTELEPLYTLQLTVAVPNLPLERSIFKVTFLDSSTVIALTDVNPNKPLALSLFRTTSNRKYTIIIVTTMTIRLMTMTTRMMTSDGIRHS